MVDFKTTRSSKRRRVSEQTQSLHTSSPNRQKPRNEKPLEPNLVGDQEVPESPQDPADHPNPQDTPKPIRSSKRLASKKIIEESPPLLLPTRRENKSQHSPEKPRSSRRSKKQTQQVIEDEEVWEVPDDDEGLNSNQRGSLMSVDADPEYDIQVHDYDQNNIDGRESDVSTPYAQTFTAQCERENLMSMLQPLCSFISEKLNGRRLIPLKGLDKEYQTVHHLIEQTVTAGEGNSLLLLGARGSGKTAIVESAIAALEKSNRDDFHVVRLNGFLHTDDKLALREIWQQLGRGNCPAHDELDQPTSYADTMASLLALLSHPEDMAVPVLDPGVDTITTTKSVVIILDEFDLFSYHPRQTLLYNLFDIAQARKAPLAVLGLTTKVDVSESLEKRVKSRFSHRYVFLPRPRTFEDFAEICMAAVKVEKEEIYNSTLIANPLTNSLENILDASRGELFLQGWNTFIRDLFGDSDFQTHLRQIYYRTKCPKDFFASALLPISTLASSVLSGKLEPPSTQSFISHSLSCPDPSPLPFSMPHNSTSSMSLPLSLLLAATRLTALNEPSQKTGQAHLFSTLTLSFPAVYGEYVRLLTSAKASASALGAAATPGRIWGKESAREAWEKLVGWGLVLPTGTQGFGDGKTYRIEASFEEIVGAMGPNASGALGRWWRDN